MDFNKLNSIVSSDYEVYSFDLFDTVFFRKYFSLEEVLLSSSRYLSGYLTQSLSPSAIVEERKRVTRTLKRSLALQTQEPKLADILTSLINRHELVDGVSSRQVVEKIISFEFSLEMKNLQLIPETLAILERLKYGDKKIICITDMYFDQQQICALLESLGVQQFFEMVFVSSEIGLTKQSGDLFTYVAHTLKTPKNRILHIGDKFGSDIRPASNSGIDSKLVTFNKGPTPAYPEIENIHNSVAQLSTAFLLDIIQQCHARKIHNIFFLSRDATLLGELCRSLADRQWIDRHFSGVTIHDLDISRASTAFLELDWADDSLSKIIDLYVKYINATDFNDFLRYFDLPALLQNINPAPLSSKDWVETIRNAGDQYESQILKKVENINRTVIEYLQQAGAIHAGNVAFVDIGYAGTIARRIAQYLMRQSTINAPVCTRIHCFLLLSNNLLAENAESSMPVAIMKTPGFLNHHTIPAILRGNGAWLEVFFQDHSRGPLLAYRQLKDGNISAQFSTMNKPEISPEVVQIKHFFDLISEDELLILSSNFQSISLIKLFLQEMAQPSTATIASLKDCQYLSGHTDQDRHALIAPLSSSELTPRKIQHLIKRDIWLAGSLQNSGHGSINAILSMILRGYYASKQLSEKCLQLAHTGSRRMIKPIAARIIARKGIVKAK